MKWQGTGVSGVESLALAEGVFFRYGFFGITIIIIIIWMGGGFVCFIVKWSVMR